MMKGPNLDAVSLARNVGYTISEAELSDYDTMLDKEISAFKLVKGRRRLAHP